MHVIAFSYITPPYPLVKRNPHEDVLFGKVIQYALRNVSKSTREKILRGLASRLGWPGLLEVLSISGIEIEIETARKRRDIHIRRIIIPTKKGDSIVIESPESLSEEEILCIAFDNVSAEMRIKMLRAIAAQLSFYALQTVLSNNGIDVQVKHREWRNLRRVLDVFITIQEEGRSPSVSGQEGGSERASSFRRTDEPKLF